MITDRLVLTCAAANALAMSALLFAAAPVYAQADAASQDASINHTIDASEADGDLPPPRGLSKFNAYEGPYVTLRVGGGLLIDYAAYSQDDESKSQMTLHSTEKLRDFRFVAKGALPKVPGLSYTLGYMYDATAESWRFRQTGLQYDVHPVWGRVFVGRTKENFSTSKIMVGYQGWTNERSTSNDAFLPILADGVKWMGNVPSGTVVYSVGAFFDKLSEDESFNKYDNQATARVVWLPFMESDPKRLLHLSVAGRYGESDDGFFRFKSKPESYPAQADAIDTGKFAAHHSRMIALESYYRPGPVMFGMEYFFNQVSSTQYNDPFFQGGEIFAAYTLTGETRPYNARGAYFEKIKPARSVFDGGPGAWEVVTRFSYTDLDSGSIKGGKFWRITPMVNWHMSEWVRLEFVYGYGVLDRFGVEGGTHFFQSRIQLQL